MVQYIFSWNFQKNHIFARNFQLSTLIRNPAVECCVAPLGYCFATVGFFFTFECGFKKTPSKKYSPLGRFFFRSIPEFRLGKMMIPTSGTAWPRFPHTRVDILDVSLRHPETEILDTRIKTVLLSSTQLSVKFRSKIPPYAKFPLKNRHFDRPKAGFWDIYAKFPL